MPHRWRSRAAYRGLESGWPISAPVTPSMAVASTGRVTMRHWTPPPGSLHTTAVKPLDITPFPADLAIKWEDGREDFIPWETLRRFCPCAGCMGEKDIMGNVYKAPERPYAANAFVPQRVAPVGSYAIQPAWADGHASGIYTWDWLRRIGDAQNQSGH